MFQPMMWRASIADQSQIGGLTIDGPTIPYFFNPTGPGDSSPGPTELSMEDHVNGYLSSMRHYATFNGRASRAEFWQFTVGACVVTFVTLVIDTAFISGPDSKAHPVAGVVALAHILPWLAVAVRRLHDVDRSGFFLFINLIPLVGFVLLLVWACEGGTKGPNQFGPNPLDAVTGPVGQPMAVTAAMTTPSMAMPPAAGSRDVVGELERLATLHSQGRLSDAEFASLKARALNPGDAA